MNKGLVWRDCERIQIVSLSNATGEPGTFHSRGAASSEPAESGQECADLRKTLCEPVLARRPVTVKTQRSRSCCRVGGSPVKGLPAYKLDIQFSRIRLS